VVERLRAVDAVQDVPKRHKLGDALPIAMLVVVGSSMATIEEASSERAIRLIRDGLWWAAS
jgi:hypothetical protein